MKETFSLYDCQKEEESGTKPTSHVYKCQKDQTVFWFGLATTSKEDGSTTVEQLCPVESQEMELCV